MRSSETYRPAADLPNLVERPGARGHPRLAEPLREGGRAAELVPRGRRLRVLPRQRAAGQRNDELSASSPRDRRRTGYCEQFASAMAAMARSLGIPARVAVGFLPTAAGRTRGPTAPATCTPGPSSTSTAPAGSGSSRRRPTGPRSAGVHDANLPGAATPEPATAPSDSGEVPEHRPTAARRGQRPRSTAAGDTGAGFPWVPVLGGVAGVVLVLARAAAPPRLVRQRRRAPADRLARAGLGRAARHRRRPRRPWPTAGRRGRPATGWSTSSARPIPTTARATRARPRVSPDGVAALDRLVLALERLRYSRGQDAGERTPGRRHRSVLAALDGGADARPGAGPPGGRRPCCLRGAARPPEEPVVVEPRRVVDRASADRRPAERRQSEHADPGVADGLELRWHATSAPAGSVRSRRPRGGGASAPPCAP